MAKRSMFVGMDVHKESIDVSLAEEGRDGEVRHYGVIPGDLEAVAKVVRTLRAPSRRLPTSRPRDKAREPISLATRCPRAPWCGWARLASGTRGCPTIYVCLAARPSSPPVAIAC